MYPDPTDKNPGVSSSILLRGGEYEPENTRVFMSLLKEGDFVLDIGSNLGWYSLLAAGIVGHSGKVIACEPEPHNFGILERSVRLNRFTNVLTVEKCVSDRTGDVTLHLSSENAGSHSIVSGGAGSCGIVVGSTTIDELHAQFNLERIDVLKIDAESAEPLILSGARNLFSKGQPSSILMEYSPEAWNGYSPLLAALFEHFSVYEIRRRPAALVRITPHALPKDRQTMLLLLRRNQEAVD